MAKADDNTVCRDIEIEARGARVHFVQPLPQREPCVGTRTLARGARADALGKRARKKAAEFEKPVVHPPQPVGKSDQRRHVGMARIEKRIGLLREVECRPLPPA